MGVSERERREKQGRRAAGEARALESPEIFRALEAAERLS